MDFKNDNKYKPKKKKRKSDTLFKKRNNFLIIALILLLFVVMVVAGVLLIKKTSPTASTPSGSQSTPNPSGADSTPDSDSSPTDPTPDSKPVFEIDSATTATNILVADLTSSKILAAKGANDKIYPASLTKLVAALIIAENCQPGEEFTVGEELSFVQPGSSTAKLKEGNVIGLEGMLDALLLASGNDASYTSALHVGRKMGGDAVKSDLDALHFFVGMMNAKAKALGAQNTQFQNPDGYHQDGHYTTCHDLLLISKAAYNNPLIKNAVSKATAEHSIKAGGRTEKITFTSTNMLLRAGNYNFPGATGMKTGTTDEAGNCLISTAERNGKTVICIMTGAPTSNARFKESYDLLTKAFSALA